MEALPEVERFRLGQMEGCQQERVAVVVERTVEVRCPQVQLAEVEEEEEQEQELEQALDQEQEQEQEQVQDQEQEQHPEHEQARELEQEQALELELELKQAQEQEQELGLEPEPVREQVLVLAQGLGSDCCLKVVVEAARVLVPALAVAAALNASVSSLFTKASDGSERELTA